MKMQELLKEKGAAVYSIHVDALLSDCIGMLNVKNVGALLVMDDKRQIHGIISERDVLRVAYAKQCQVCDLPVREVMTPREKLILGTPQDTIESVMELMTANRIRHLPIMEGDKLVGLVSVGDVVKARLELTAVENQQMKDYISGRYA